MLGLNARKRFFVCCVCICAVLATVCCSRLCAHDQQVGPSGDRLDLDGAVQTLPVIEEALHPPAWLTVQDDEPAVSAGAVGTRTWLPGENLVSGRLWFSMDILGWATKGVHAPPLVLHPTINGFGQPGTRILFGGETIQDEMRPGGRLTVGWWFDPDQVLGIEWQYFEIDGENIRFRADASDLWGRLARPLINASTGLEQPFDVDPVAGSLRVASDLQLTSTGIVLRDLFWTSEFARVDYLIGYRHAHLFDQLRVRHIDATGSLDLNVLETFRAVNQFDGLDLGLNGRWSRTGRLAVTGLAKIAFGASNNHVTIDGSTTATVSGTTAIIPIGILARPSNIGRRGQREFGVLGELGIGLEWQPAPSVKFSLGYTWLYWSDVARAASHVDRTIDPNLNGIRPAFDLQTTSFWAQGLNAGFTLQF